MLFGMDKVELKFTQVRMGFHGHSFKFNISEEALAKTDTVNLFRKPWQRFRGWQLTGRQELEGWGGLLRNCCLMSCLRSQVMLMDGDVKIMTMIRSAMAHEGSCLMTFWKSRLIKAMTIDQAYILQVQMWKVLKWLKRQSRECLDPPSIMLRLVEIGHWID